MIKFVNGLKSEMSEVEIADYEQSRDQITSAVKEDISYEEAFTELLRVMEGD